MSRVKRMAHALFAVMLLLPVCSAQAESLDPALQAAISGDQRSPENVRRDAHRHPGETLAFFGIRPDMQLIELWPGGGWYTEILAPYLRDRGHLTAASFGADNPVPFRARYHRKFMDKLKASPAVYDRVSVITLDPPQRADLGPANSADMVLTFRNLHNWINDDALEAVFQAVYRVLKPGGIFGVVEHRGIVGADVKASSRQGYVPEAYVIETLEKIGFLLAGRSELNANPKDDKQHPKGVWTLPPSYRLGDTDRAKYAAIGESDRMTLKFVKP